MKKILSKKTIYIIIIAICCVLCSSLSVWAYSYFAKDVSYKKADGTEISVENALNELYSSQTKSKKYVTNGLVFGFDALINYNSYSSHNVTLKNDMAYFNGSNSYVAYPRYQNSNITYEVDFIKENDNSGDILSSAQLGGYVISSSGNEIYFGVNVNGNYYYTTTSSENGKETHIVGTYDGSKLKIYLNGKNVGKKELNGAFKQNTESTITAIGANPRNTYAENGYFKGYIRSARVYNRALTDEEVLNNYNYELSRR